MATEQSVPMEKAWSPRDVEPELYRSWEEAGLFTADPDNPRPKFSVVLPPPNVTGELQLRRAPSGTIQDACSRRGPVLAREVVGLPGTAHAAFGTENVSEKRLAAEGRTK